MASKQAELASSACSPGHTCRPARAEELAHISEGPPQQVACLPFGWQPEEYALVWPVGHQGGHPYCRIVSALRPASGAANGTAAHLMQMLLHLLLQRRQVVQSCSLHASLVPWLCQHALGTAVNSGMVL